MHSTQPIIGIVGRVTGRVRMWRLIDVFVRAGKWCIPFVLGLFILDKLLSRGVPVWILVLPGVAFLVAFVFLAFKGLSGVNRYEVAKIIDDQMGLKDRLTSALYFDRLSFSGGLAAAAVEEACSLAGHLDTRRLSVGSWPRHSGRFAIALVLTAVVAVGPLRLADFFTRSKKDAGPGTSNQTQPVTPTTDAGTLAPEVPLKHIEPKKPITELTKLEAERPPERDPNTLDTAMPQDLLDEIENIKAALDAKDLKDMEEAFKDDKDKASREERDEKPPKIAPLDKELLEDIARGEKKKVGKDEKGADDAIGVAVRMPAQPGAKQKGPSSKGRGGHGGGDVGESGDTRAAPRRVPVPGRDKLIIESRRSKDILEKGELEQVVMNELMMRLSMKDVKMVGTATDVKVEFGPQLRTSVLEEIVPLGLRGYVQRYFQGLGGRRETDKPETAPPAEE